MDKQQNASSSQKYNETGHACAFSIRTKTRHVMSVRTTLKIDDDVSKVYHQLKYVFNKI